MVPPRNEALRAAPRTHAGESERRALGRVRPGGGATVPRARPPRPEADAGRHRSRLRRTGCRRAEPIARPQPEWSCPFETRCCTVERGFHGSTNSRRASDEAASYRRRARDRRSLPSRTRRSHGGAPLPRWLRLAEEGVSSDGACRQARVQTGLPGQRGAGDPWGVFARLHGAVRHREDRLRGRSRRLPRVLSPGPASWFLYGRLPRRVRPEPRGLRAGRGGTGEDVRAGVSDGIGSPRVSPGVRCDGAARRGDMCGELRDVCRGVFVPGRMRRREPLHGGPLRQREL